MGPIGLPELLIVSSLLILVGGIFILPVVFVVSFRRRAKRLGYPSVGAYLKAAPGTDAERRDAADMALKGLAVCLLGLIMPPLVLVGLVPLFYGGRKLAYASLGLGLIDDADRPDA